MIYCSKCGKEVSENDKHCPYCGFQLKEEAKEEVAKNPDSSDVLGLIAKIFMLASTIICGVGLIPLCWMVPMTVSVWKKHNNYEKIGVGLKICTLLFVNLIAGILLLCRDESDKK